MKMKMFSFFLLLCANSILCHAQVNTMQDEVAAMLKRFYTDYIRILNNADNVDSIDSVLTENLDSKLKQEISKRSMDTENDEWLDFDPLIAAQDVDPEWIQSLTITALNGFPNTYVVAWAVNEYYQGKLVKNLSIITLRVAMQKKRYVITDIIIPRWR